MSVRRLVLAALLLGAVVGPLQAQTIATIAGNPARSGVPLTQLAAVPFGSAVAQAPNGDIIVATQFAVYRMSGGVITLVAGNGTQGGTLEGSPATSTRLMQIGDVAANAAGDVFVSDEIQGRVYRVRAADGVIERLAGGGTLRGVSAAGDAIRVDFPTGLAVDGAGRLLFVDGPFVYRADPATRQVQHVAGNGQFDFSGDGGPATAAGVACGDLALDAAQNVYCAEGGRIRRFTVGGTITTFAGTGTFVNTGDGGPAASAQVEAIDLAVGGTSLFFSGLARVRRIDLATTIVSAVAGTDVQGSSGDGGSALAANISPNSISAGPTGTLSILEARKLRAVVSDNIDTVAFNGTFNSGVGGPALNAQLSGPTALAADGSGSVYVASRNQVFRREAGGTLTLIAGVGTNDVFQASGDGGPAAAAGLISAIDGLALDGSGGLYISQSFGSHRVRRVNLGTGVIANFAGTGASGFTGDGGTATAATLSGPSGMVVSLGFLYIADQNNHRIRRVDLATNLITTFAGSGSSTASGDGGDRLSAGIPSPSHLAVDGSGRLYVASNRQVRRISGNTITTVAGTGALGTPLEGATAISQPLQTIGGLAVNAAGDLYIADFENNRVWTVPVATGRIATLAGTGEIENVDVFDIGVFSGDGGPAGLAGLNSPQGLALDSTGGLLISDTFNARLRRVTGLANQPPTLVAPGNVTIPEDTALPIALVVGDATTAPEALMLSATSSDPSVVSASGLVVSGTGANRTLTITPVANRVGTTTISLLLQDTDGGVTRRSFTFTTTAVNDPPTLEPIADVAGGDTGVLTRTLTFFDPDGPSRIFTLTSSNAAVMPTGNMAITGPTLGPRTLTLAPVAGSTGSSVITVRLSDGTLSVERNFTVTIDRTPAPPTFEAGTVDGQVVEVEWAAPPPGITPTGYRVEAGPASGVTTVSADIDPRARRHDLLLPSTGDWFVRVRTLNGGAASAPSAEKAVTLTGTPGRPRDFTASVAGNVVTFRWTPPTNGSRTAYDLQAGSAAGLADLVTLPLSPTATNLTVGAPNGTFFVRVVARNAAGGSAPSNEVRLVVGATPGVPGAPSDFRADADGATAVFRWSAPDTGGPPSGVVLDAGTASGIMNLVTGLPMGNATSFLASAPAGTFFVRARAVNAAGSSPPSGEAVLVVPGAGLPTAPRLLRVNVDTGRVVTFAWNRPDAGAATGYTLEVGSASGLTDLVTLPLGPATTFQVTAPPGTFFVRLRARNAAGVSAASDEVQLVVP